MKVLTCLMLAHVALAVSSTCVRAAPLAGKGSLSETADFRCNEMMKALSAGNYTAATALRSHHQVNL
jgi:hypothetical protein